jgi:hypothetical protein
MLLLPETLDVEWMRSRYSDTTECFTEVTTSTDEGDFEVVFGDVVDFICRGQYFTFVDVVNSNCFENLISAIVGCK